MATNIEDLLRVLSGEAPQRDLTAARSEPGEVKQGSKPCPEGQTRGEDGECRPVMTEQPDVAAAPPTEASGPLGRRIISTSPVIEPRQEKPNIESLLNTLSGEGTEDEFPTTVVDLPLNESVRTMDRPEPFVTSDAPVVGRPRPPATIGPVGASDILAPLPPPINPVVEQALVALGNFGRAVETTPGPTGFLTHKSSQIRRRLENLVRPSLGLDPTPVTDEELEQLDEDLSFISRNYGGTAVASQLIGTMAPIITDLMAAKRVAGLGAERTTGRTSRVLEDLSRWSHDSRLKSAAVNIGEDVGIQAGFLAAGDLSPEESVGSFALSAAAGAAFPGGSRVRAVLDDVVEMGPPGVRAFDFSVDAGEDGGGFVRGIFDADSGHMELNITQIGDGPNTLGPSAMRDLGKQIIEQAEAQGIRVQTIGGERITGVRTSAPAEVVIDADRLRDPSSRARRGTQEAEPIYRAPAIRVEGEISEGATHADAAKRAGYDPDDMFDEVEFGVTDRDGVFHAVDTPSEGLRAEGKLPIGKIPEGGYRSRFKEAPARSPIEETASYIEYTRGASEADRIALPPDRRPPLGSEARYREVLTRNTKGDAPWRITQLRDGEPVFHQEFVDYDRARKALDELAEEHGAMVKPIQGRVVTRDQLLNDPRAGYLLLPDPKKIVERIRREGSDLLQGAAEKEVTLPLVGKTSIRREFFVQGDLPKPVFDRMIENNAAIKAHTSRMEYNIRELDRTIDEAIKIEELEKEFADVMVNTALNAKGREALLALPARVRPAVEAMRAHIDALTQRGIDLGLFSGERTSVYVRNEGIYLNRAYESHGNPRWARESIDPTIVNRAKAYIRSPHRFTEVAPNGQVKVKKNPYDGLTDEQMDVVIDRLLYQDEISPMVVAARQRLGQKDLTAMRQRFLDAKPIRDLMGEFEGGRGNYARSIYRMVNLVENHNFLLNARDEMLRGGWISTKENLNPAHLTEIAAEGSEVMAPLNGFYTTPQIKRAFEEALSGGVESQWPAMYMQAVAVTKYAKTGFSAQTHVRNFTSAGGFGMMNGNFNPFAVKTWRNLHLAMRATTADLGRAGPARGFKEVRGLPSVEPATVVQMALNGDLDLSDGDHMLSLFNRLTELGVTYDGARYGEFKKVMEEAFTNRTPMDWMEFRSQRFANKVMDVTGNLYRAEDDVWKAHGFFQEYARWRDVFPSSVPNAEIEKIAADFVRNGYPTYSLAPLMVRRFRGNPTIGPFAVFSAEIIRTVQNVVMRTARDLDGIDPRTGEIATDPEIRAAIQDIGKKRLAGMAVATFGSGVVADGARQMVGISEETDRDFREFLPPWAQNSQLVWLKNEPESGRLQYIDISYNDPYNYMKRPVLALLNGDDPQEAMIDALKELAEPFFGIDIFTEGALEVAAAYMNHGEVRGRKLINLEDDGFNQGLAIASHMWETMEPGTITSARRIAKGFKWLSDENGREFHGWEELMATALGVRVTSVDVPTSIFFRAEEFANRLGDARGLLASEAYKQGEVNPDDLAAAFEESDNARRQIYEEFSRLIHSARVFGMEDRDIKSQIEAGSARAGFNRLSNREIQNLMNGMYHPWTPDVPMDRPDAIERKLQLMDLSTGARGMDRGKSSPEGLAPQSEEVEALLRKLEGRNDG